MLECTVIISSHNPRQKYFGRVLSALREQTLCKNSWELLLIDNASDQSLAKTWDLGWHPQARHLREEQLGKLRAWVLGISQARADLIVFVDDDNVLQSDYLEIACRIATKFPQIGAFGCSIKGEFETAVPDWAGPYLDGLCVKEIERDRWGNDYSWSDAVPYGAGMCVRNIVAQRYSAALKGDELRIQLDRSGSRLISGGDLDLAWTAIDVGLGTGRFCDLKATHLISKNRLTQDYLVRLYAGFAYSNNIVWATRGLIRENSEKGWRDNLRYWIAFIKLRGIQRLIYFASRRATKAAWQVLKSSASREADDRGIIFEPQRSQKKGNK